MALESGWVHGLGLILAARKWLSPHGDGKERLGFRVYSVGFRSTGPSESKNEKNAR